jgi:mannitol/fructose-specific phosphotransferase system IIA component (Ntr-type)
MIDLRDYVKPNLIIKLEPGPFSQIVDILISACAQDSSLYKEALASVLASTKSGVSQEINLGKGFALIHARSSQCQTIKFTLGLLPSSKPYMKGEAVQFLFCIILPDSESRQYLSLLARLGRLLNQEDSSSVFAKAAAVCHAANLPTAQTLIMDYIQSFETI